MVAAFGNFQDVLCLILTKENKRNVSERSERNEERVSFA